VKALCDTSVWIDYLNGRDTAKTDRLDGLIGQENVVVGDLILFELLQGVRGEREHDALLRRLEPFGCVEMLGHRNAVRAAENHRRLRALGITIRKAVDLFIGTFCIENALSLLHNDRGFDPMAEHLGLRVL